MDSDKLVGSGALRIEKLSDDNYHIWKQEIELVLAYREVDVAVIEENQFQRGCPEYTKWKQCDKMARAIIGLSLSDDMLEHVRECSSAREMLQNIKNVFQRHTLLNKLRARRQFYTVEMKQNEKMLTYINRVQHCGSVLKSMEVDIDSKEIAIAILNGLPSEYESLITTLDALEDDKNLFTLELIKSRLLQEEKRKEMGNGNNSEAVLIASSRVQQFNRAPIICSHCKRRGHRESTCWDKFPSLRPSSNSSFAPKSQNQALVAGVELKSLNPKEDFICLLAQKHGVSTSFENPNEVTWFIDSGASSHMTPNSLLFSTFNTTKPFFVQMGDNSQAKVRGQGNIELQVKVGEGLKTCVLNDVLFVPSLHYSLISVGRMCNNGLKVSFSENQVVISDRNKSVAAGSQRGSLYVLNMVMPERALYANLETWHARLGHSSPKGILQMSSNNVARNLEIGNKTLPNVCEVC